MDYKQLSEGQTEANEEYSLSLKDLCENSIGHRHRSLKSINSDVTYTINFESDKIPSVEKTFVIRNQKYFAKRIELTVNIRGVSPYMVGEFYRIKV